MQRLVNGYLTCLEALHDLVRKQSSGLWLREARPPVLPHQLFERVNNIPIGWSVESCEYANAMGVSSDLEKTDGEPR
jgi:hypothetical protein